MRIKKREGQVKKATILNLHGGKNVEKKAGEPGFKNCASSYTHGLVKQSPIVNPKKRRLALQHRK